MAFSSFTIKFGSFITDFQTELATSRQDIIHSFELLFIKASLSTATCALDVEAILLKVAEVHAQLLSGVQKEVHIELGGGHVDVDEVILDFFSDLFHLINVNLGTVNLRLLLANANNAASLHFYFSIYKYYFILFHI